MLILRLLIPLLSLFAPLSAYTAVSVSAIAADPNDYDVTFYHLDLNVSDSSTFLSGSTAIHIRSKINALSSIVFDFSNQLVTDSVQVDGIEASWSHQSSQLFITPANPINNGALVIVRIFYHGLGKNTETEGIYSQFVSNWNRRVTWTLTESFSALNFFPCKQSLTDKADSVYVFLSTDSHLKAGSNGLLTASVPLEGNRVRYEWKSRYPIAYYLISLAVSDYMDYSFYVKVPGYNDSILVQNYIINDPDYLVQNKENIDRTGDLIVLYSELFGLYPFSDEKYGHCLAPFSGGMEHQTMTTLINFSFLLVAHELTHQWFGDHVTCSTWQDIWINEGFASYGEYLAYQYLVSQENADNWIQSCNNIVKSASGGSVYVPAISAGDEGRIFNSRLSYKKGASIIHMLRQEIGSDSQFFNIITSFLSRYGNGNASGADFRDHVEEQSGRDYNQFFEQWYFGEGYPIHAIRWDHRNDTLYINSLQTPSTGNQFFNLLFEFRATGDNVDTIVTFRQDAEFKQWQIYLPGNVSNIEADPGHWLLADLSDISMINETDIEIGFTVMPNPARNTVKIEPNNGQPAGRYTIYMADASGKIMVKRESVQQSESINVNSYPSGLYFIIIKQGRKSYYKKLIIN